MLITMPDLSEKWKTHTEEVNKVTRKSEIRSNWQRFHQFYTMSRNLGRFRYNKVFHQDLSLAFKYCNEGRPRHGYSRNWNCYWSFRISDTMETWKVCSYRRHKLKSLALIVISKELSPSLSYFSSLPSSPNPTPFLISWSYTLTCLTCLYSYSFVIIVITDDTQVTYVLDASVTLTHLTGMTTQSGTWHNWGTKKLRIT